MNHDEHDRDPKSSLDRRRFLGGATALGATVAWVQQCEMDHRTPQSFVNAFLLELEAWITAANAVLPAANKVTETLFMTTRDTEVWTRRAGFDLHRTIYRRPVR